MKKIALVTGGGRGIGLGIASHLAEEGCDLVICGVREESAVAAALTALRDRGAEVLYCRADVSSSAGRSEMLEEIKAHYGRLNVLVNNAGVAPSVRTDILEADEASFDRLMAINLKGPYFLTQAVAKWMIEQQQSDAAYDACIINVSSISASVASPTRGDYCITKAGVGMATQLYAVRLGEFGIPVYEIRPGIIKTDMTAGVTEKYDRLIGEGGILVQARWGLPEDVGRAAAMLVRGDLAYSTGQVLMVDGGFTLQRL
ncbi:MAG: 3-ketoacyl-ACP reductase [Lentisphaerae bacterium]|nr:3-ketoacyl-ACP reductase [Lentisphaerota bacterium]